MKDTWQAQENQKKKQRQALDARVDKLVKELASLADDINPRRSLSKYNLLRHSQAQVRFVETAHYVVRRFRSGDGREGLR